MPKQVQDSSTPAERPPPLSAATPFAILIAAACAALAIARYVYDVYVYKGSLTLPHAGLLLLALAWMIAATVLIRLPVMHPWRPRLRTLCQTAVFGLPPILAGHATRAYWQAIYGPAPMPALYRLSFLLAMLAAGLLGVAFVAQRLLGPARAIRALTAIAVPALVLFLVEAVWSSVRPPFPGPLKIAGDGGFITERLDEKTLGYPYIYRANMAYREQWGSNPRGYFDAGNGLDYIINGLGLRGTLPSPRRDRDAMRIVFLGDSFTFGEGVREEDTLPQQVAAVLRKSSGRRVECVNGGVGGFDTRQEIALYRDRLAAFDADAVVVVMGLNDRSPSSMNELRVPRAGEIGRLSTIVDTLRTAIAARLAGDAPHTVDAYEACFSALAELRDALRPDQRLIVALYPYVDVLPRYPFEQLHRDIADRLSAMAIPAIDLLPVLRPLADRVLTVHPQQDTHPNEVAHAAAAAAIAADLRTPMQVAAQVEPAGEDE